MTDADLRTEFEAKARNLEPFKLVEFNRFATGEFVSLAAEMAYIGYRMRDEELKNGN